MSSREKTQSDFDLDRFIELFDAAVTSTDPGVRDTLGHLMTITALTLNHDPMSRRDGPLRQLYTDMNNLHKRVSAMEDRAQYADRDRTQETFRTALMKQTQTAMLPQTAMQQLKKFEDIVKDPTYKGSSIGAQEC